VLDEFLGASAKLRKSTVSFVMSVRVEQLGSHWTDFREFGVVVFFEILSKNFKLH